MDFNKGSEKCLPHNVLGHDFFLNHLESAERPSESKFEISQLLYESLSALKTNDGVPISVFWGKICCNPRTDPDEKRILHGLLLSKIIILLISRKALERIAELTAQDNILLEYECALLRHKLDKTMVVPIFISDSEHEHSFTFNFPETSHTRIESAQKIVEKLSEGIAAEDKDFLGSAKKTMHQIFQLNGFILPHQVQTKEIEELSEIMKEALETGTIPNSPRLSFRPLPFIPPLPLPLVMLKDPKYFTENISDDSEGYFSAGDSDFDLTSDRDVDYSSDISIPSVHTPTPRPKEVHPSNSFVVNYIILLSLVVVLAKILEMFWFH